MVAKQSTGSGRLVKFGVPGILALLILQSVFGFVQDQTNTGDIKPANVYNLVESMREDIRDIKSDITPLQGTLDRNADALDNLNKSVIELTILLKTMNKQ